MSKIVKKSKPIGLWAFLTKAAKSPTSFEVFSAIGRAELLLVKCRSIRSEQLVFEREAALIEKYRRILHTSEEGSYDYRSAQSKLFKLLKL